MYDSAPEHATGHVSVSEARDTFAELVNRAAYGHERVLVARRGRPIAAIVPIEDVQLLERLEDERDLRLAREALEELKQAPATPLDQVERELGR